MNVLSCGPKAQNISGISEAISPPNIRKKSSQHVRALGLSYTFLKVAHIKIAQFGLSF